MSRSLLSVMVRQIIGSPRKTDRSTAGRKPRNRDHEQAMYKLKQAAFRNRKAYEQAQHLAKSKGWIK